MDPIVDVRARLAAFGYAQGVGSFLGAWSERNPLNIPGPAYVGEDDSCGTGQEAAPNNVWLPTNGEEKYVANRSGEFIFRQPSSDYELRQIVLASDTNTMAAYAIDGDEHWTRQAVHDWWRTMLELRNTTGLKVPAYATGARAWTIGQGPRLFWPSAELRRWVDFMEDGAQEYLRRYLAVLDEGWASAEGVDIRRLPQL